MRTFRTDCIHSWDEVDESRPSSQTDLQTSPQKPARTSAASVIPNASQSADKISPVKAVQQVQPDLTATATSAAEHRLHILQGLFFVAFVIVGGKWLFQGGSLADVLESIFAPEQYRESQIPYIVTQINDSLHSRLGYYYMEGGMTWDGSVIERGYYVPIDYELVGGTSNAMKRNWRLEQIYTPEKIYGRVM